MIILCCEWTECMSITKCIINATGNDLIICLSYLVIIVLLFEKIYSQIVLFLKFISLEYYCLQAPFMSLYMSLLFIKNETTHLRDSHFPAGIQEVFNISAAFRHAKLGLEVKKKREKSHVSTLQSTVRIQMLSKCVQYVL